ncbi:MULTISPECIES: amidohydrolase family protein [Actinomycetes]|uniref:amidohydrolase family protein n=1 Tax=Actinomycetes TaxID=1760 RepID=UPI0010A8E9D2|nr:MULTISPECIES: amidohydrolase family protein [Actinomycetes]
MIIDAHVHVWDLTRGGYDWPDSSVPQLHRNLSLDDIGPTLDERGIDGVVLVQSADTAVDTLNMLDQAVRHNRVRGVVGWANLGANPDAFATAFDELRVNRMIVGLRNLMHVKGVRGWILGEHQRENVAAVAIAGLPLDVVTSTHDELSDVVALLEATPNLRVVVDHLGKPPIGGTDGARREWRALLTDIAGDPMSTAKLSGLSAAAGPLDAWTSEQVAPFIDDALELFGPDRLLFGGDWPVVLLAGGYARAWSAVTGALAALDDAERAAVLGGTAARVYGL